MTNTIMLVEDEVIVAMDVRQRLETLGYQVVAHATSGEEAVRSAKETSPNLILMDIKIRGAMDGIETAAKIRASQDIPIIYLTAFADDATLKRASLTEAFGYLIKPFEDRELRSAIEIALYKHSMEQKLRESEERYALAARATNGGIWDWNLISGEVYYAPRWKTLLGLPEDQIINLPQQWLERVHPEDIERLNLAIADHLKGLTPTLECEYRIMHQDGGYRWVICRGLALFNAQRKPYRIAGSHSDISTQKQIEEQLIHRALHDELTSLPNRALFIDRLKMVLENTRRIQEKSAAVLFLDIDHFKVINDSLGHISGDALLNAFAYRLKQCLRPGDTVARFGGDEFAILVDGISTDEEATQIADRICRELRKPFSIEEHEVFNTASIGIVFVTSHYHSVDDLLRDVDTAMYYAKNNGRSRFEVFNMSMHENSINRLQQEGEIRRALKNSEFILHYQPIYKVDTLELVGFEALIRWQHPVRGLLLPAEFIKVAEETGLIVPIGEWVLREACSQAQIWQNAFNTPLKMSVNLSAVQFTDKDLINLVRNVLSESKFDPHLLELELTETVAMQNIEKTLETLKEFQQMGVSISIDDFGSGYSSLDHIRYLPTNTLKIDRSFIKDIKIDDSAIVEAIITMAHQLHLKVVAEGIETESQLSILTHINCDQVQGFFLGKGVAPDVVESLVLPNARKLSHA
ncbi:MAG: EAL domain-containing protein [Anaerolineaceae bacterium]|nr:EAL domain-containing protein [Anaerolineaceae bacterium]